MTENMLSEDPSTENTSSENTEAERTPNKNAFGKHMVWAVDPRTQSQIGIGYSSFVEAEMEAQKLEQVGYKILKITPTTLPKPNS